MAVEELLQWIKIEYGQIARNRVKSNLPNEFLTYLIYHREQPHANDYGSRCGHQDISYRFHYG